MAVIQIKNPDVSNNVQTFLSQEYLSGATLNVDSSVGFADNNYIIVGEPGLENSELTDLTATPPNKTSLTITALSFTHARGTPVYYVSWDKYSLEYRASSSDSWSVYGSMPLPLKYDSVYTEYRDPSATSTYQWRYRYYSTENSAYSDYSDTISAAGWPKNSVGHMVDNVRKVINDPTGKTVSDSEIIRYFNTAQLKVYSVYNRWWFLLKQGTAIDTQEGVIKYALPSDFGRMDRVTFNYAVDATDITYNLKYISPVEFEYESRDNNAGENDEVKYYTIYPGDSDNESGYLSIWPKPETDGLDIVPWYYKTMTDLDSYADETVIPVPSMLEDYALGEIYKIKKEENRASYYDKLFREQIELLKLTQKKQVGQPKQLWKYKGRMADERFFGTRSIDDDTKRELYW